MGIKKNHYKDPYQTSRIQIENKSCFSWLIWWIYSKFQESLSFGTNPNWHLNGCIVCPSWGCLIFVATFPYFTHKKLSLKGHTSGVWDIFLQSNSVDEYRKSDHTSGENLKKSGRFFRIRNWSPKHTSSRWQCFFSWMEPRKKNRNRPEN